MPGYELIGKEELKEVLNCLKKQNLEQNGF